MKEKALKYGPGMLALVFLLLGVYLVFAYKQKRDNENAYNGNKKVSPTELIDRLLGEEGVKFDFTIGLTQDTYFYLLLTIMAAILISAGLIKAGSLILQKA